LGAAIIGAVLHPVRIDPVVATTLALWLALVVLGVLA
jgi:hypothetical protein